MMKCRRRQTTDPQKFKKLSTVVFLFFVSGSGSGGSGSGSDRCGSGSCWKITASTSLVLIRLSAGAKWCHVVTSSWSNILLHGLPLINLFQLKISDKTNIHFAVHVKT